MTPILYGLGALVAAIGGWWQYNRPKVGDTVILKKGAGVPIERSTDERASWVANMPPLVVKVTMASLTESGIFRGSIVGIMNGSQQVTIDQLAAVAPIVDKAKDVSNVTVEFRSSDVQQNTTPKLF